MTRIWRYGAILILFGITVSTASAEQPEDKRREGRGFYDTSSSAIDKGSVPMQFPDSMEMGLQYAIDLGLQYSPLIRTELASLRGAEASYDSVQALYRNLYNLDADAVAQRFRTKPSAGPGGDGQVVEGDSESITVSPSATRLFRNGTRLTLSGTAEGLRDGDRVLGDNFNRHEDYHENARADLSVPLNSRARLDIRHNLRSSEINYIQAEHSLYLREKNLVQSITIAYWNVIQQEELTKIQRARLGQDQILYDNTKVMLEAGYRSEYTLSVSEITLINSETTLLDRERQLADTYEDFNNLLGIPIGTNLTLTEALTTEPLPYGADAYIAMVLEHNVELRDARLSVERSENSLTLARLGQQPSVDIRSSLGRNEEGDHDSSALLSFRWPFGDGGRTRALVRAAEANLEQSRIQLWSLERDLVRAVDQNLRTIQIQAERIEKLGKNEESARVNLEVGELQYGEGQITIRELQDNQIDLQRAEQDLVVAKVSYINSVSRLYNDIHADFPLWQAHRVESGEGIGSVKTLAATGS